MLSPLPRELPVVWLRVWIGIGAFALLVVIVVPALLAAYVTQELDRKQACEHGRSTQCDPSFVWVLKDAADQGSSQDDQAVDTSAPLGTERRMSTSDTAPSIDSVDIGGATLSNHWYSAPAGSDLHLTAIASGDPQSVEVYTVSKGTETAGVGTHVATMNKTADGVYELTYTVPAGLSADLEFRAVGGPNEYGSLLVNIREQK